MNRPWLWLAVLALGAQIAACSPWPDFYPAPTPTPDSLAAYRPSLQAWAQPHLESLGPLPRYAISAELSPSGDRLAGRMSVVVPNTSRAPWPDLVFRLYPAMPQYGGAMSVTQVTLNGRPVAAEPVAGANGTAVRLALPEPLAPRGEATVAMDFSVDLPQGSDGYTLFGWEDGILSLPGFYPTLAVRDEAMGGGRWVADVPPLFADVLFSSVALYDLEFTAPARLTVVASGATLQTSERDGMRTWHIAGGPLRDMTILASDRWSSASDQAAGATITSYYPAGDQAAGQAALFHAAAALRLFSDHYGNYPYAEFKVVAAPLGRRGMEYSGLVTIGEDLYGAQRGQLSFLVAHETGHQWWYAQVGNDPLADAWLDEGPTEYAAFDYYRGVYGQAAAETLLSGRWQTPYAFAAAHGINGPVWQPASALTAGNYELLVYAKAALFFNALRQRLGDKMYMEVMRTYVETYRWQIVTPQHFFGLAQTVSSVNLNPLAEEWLH